MSEYQAAHRRACASAITALGNRIALYSGSTRVGTVYADTTWGEAADINEGGVDKAQVTGSQVTITIPAGTVSNGTTIDRYGILNGSTLLRTEILPVSLVVNDGGQEAQVQVTPRFKYRGE
ncbi:hypothetical protein SEA_REINDEER_32 [Mycobacterium phage Reindeer]|uniref:Uncharacterized protein n=1 Tax=Mycobacterium phage Reindeer TaxID=2762283 RepID=A0A7G8LHX0_9CAUD|nr:hypothetical protein J4U05_gp032 [Mycobacterium phage Reindeer]QNJ56842.1 hypothetical protein SEA_REINDEER_32 [Mycobacterium phage Reindeer]